MNAKAAFLCGLFLSLGACATATATGAGSAPPSRDAIAKVHASKCGSCHTPPDPDTRTREHIEDAFSRHRKRVRLTNEQWAMMVDYLALPDGKTARQPPNDPALDR